MAEEQQAEDPTGAPAAETAGERPVQGGGPLRVDLPADQAILRNARVLAADGNSRISALATLALRDPVLTLELIKTANTVIFAGDRPAIGNVRTALVRLGSSSIIDLLDALVERGNNLEEEVSIEFDTLRKLSVHIAEISALVASIANHDLKEMAQIAGLMTQLGHMIACAHLGSKYTKLAANRSRAAIVYKLQQDHHFDVSGIQLGYLRMRGMPQDMFFALDRDLPCKTPSQSALRFIVASAAELVEAFALDKLDKYAKQGTLPSKSSLRLLKLTEAQHELMYESVTEYLVHGSKRPSSAIPELETEREQNVPRDDRSENLQNFDPLDAVEAELSASVATEGVSTQDPLSDAETPKELSEDAKRVVALIKHICMECSSTHDLLNKVLNILITAGPYRRAALIVLGNGNKSAMIHTEVGTGLGKGAQIPIDDPLSPLALCLTKLRSFNAKGVEDVLSPFGLTSYALSPIKVKHTAPVVLYADCGLDKPLALEARKIFRLVVGLLNTVLPRLPGGLPQRSARTERDTNALGKPA